MQPRQHTHILIGCCEGCVTGLCWITLSEVSTCSEAVIGLSGSPDFGAESVSRIVEKQFSQIRIVLGTPTAIALALIRLNCCSKVSLAFVASAGCIVDDCIGRSCEGHELLDQVEGVTPRSSRLALVIAACIVGEVVAIHMHGQTRHLRPRLYLGRVIGGSLCYRRSKGVHTRLLSVDRS
ncbi:portal protein [Sphingomonas phage Scott]|uniref:Portal protein n=1 Tax=Sphingomonas phage Scott TaxID=2282912 RepID=A0A346FDE0_9CAUD|nr:portal protein [Sphingomonas phage Scott]AXN53754.1 portal protein [Sphingomonas phage Scott]